jgi:hypothetical protein
MGGGPAIFEDDEDLKGRMGPPCVRMWGQCAGPRGRGFSGENARFCPERPIREVQE